MNCRDIDELLARGQAPGSFPAEAREHLQSCAVCRALAQPGESSDYAVNTAVLDGIATRIGSTLSPVRPLASAAVFVATFLAILVAIAVAGAAHFGIPGLIALMPLQRLAIFGALLAVAVVAALSTAWGMRPGARVLPGAVVAAIALVAMEVVFLALFHDYSMRQFVPAGVPCMKAGLLCAFPAGILMWMLVRRGFVVAPASTGAAAGALAGATGLAMLELHCPLLTAPHIAIWHGGVLAVMIGLGALAGSIARARQKPE